MQLQRSVDVLDKAFSNQWPASMNVWAFSPVNPAAGFAWPASTATVV